MKRPDDIPQDIWDKAATIYEGRPIRCESIARAIFAERERGTMKKLEQVWVQNLRAVIQSQRQFDAKWTEIFMSRFDALLEAEEAIAARVVGDERRRCARLLEEGCTIQAGEPIDPAMPEILYAIEKGFKP